MSTALNGLKAAFFPSNQYKESRSIRLHPLAFFVSLRTVSCPSRPAMAGRKCLAGYWRVGEVIDLLTTSVEVTIRNCHQGLSEFLFYPNGLCGILHGYAALRAFERDKPSMRFAECNCEMECRTKQAQNWETDVQKRREDL